MRRKSRPGKARAWSRGAISWHRRAAPPGASSGQNASVGSRAFSVTFEVRFPEVDSYGVVWHGHYVQYFEVARNALCAAFGLTPADALAHGYKVPITRVSMDLKRPARLDDRLSVTALLASPETAKLSMAYEIRREATGDLLASGATEQVILDPAGQLLLTFPAPVKTLVARILAFQRGEAEPDASKILPPR
jgi:acyl-CoA thioester hydrolase